MGGFGVYGPFHRMALRGWTPCKSSIPRKGYIEKEIEIRPWWENVGSWEALVALRDSAGAAVELFGSVKRLVRAFEI